MWKYVLKRIGLALLTAFIILSLTFILIKLLPAQRFIGTTAQKSAYYNHEVTMGYMYKSETALEGVEYVDKVIFDDGSVVYYYKTPVLQQYVSWIGNIITKWDWGRSVKIQPNVDVTVIIGNRLATSMKINIISVLLSVPLGIALGIWAALKKNKLIDHVISTVVMILIALPGFVLITFLLLAFCYNGSLPTQWPVPTDPLSKRAAGYVLPVLCLSLGSICGYCRFVRAELCEVMESDYLLLARTKGLTRGQAIMRHALRNAMVPIFPSILSEFLGILGGSMILERLYGIPGLGDLFVRSMNSASPDYNVLFVDMAIFTTLGLLAGVLLDMSYGFIDPRIRMGAR